MIHFAVDRTLAPSVASVRQLEEMGVPGLARWPRGVDLDLFDPVPVDLDYPLIAKAASSASQACMLAFWPR